MGTCFVIQPFDRGKYDKRYDDVFSPAIRAAGLEPYRVDHDPSVSIPIDDIQKGIEASTACLADITTDNPNVWFELGYAIAAQKEVVLVCSDERTSKFPFDVQHRSIIKYITESSSDYDQLRTKIESRIKAMLQRREKMGEVAQIQSAANVEGLDQHEIAVLVSVAEQVEDPSGTVSSWLIREAMEKAGFTQIATTLGLKALLDKEMLKGVEEENYDNTRYMAYRVTNYGMNWLLQNRESLVLTRHTPPPGIPPNDDIAF